MVLAKWLKLVEQILQYIRQQVFCTKCTFNLGQIWIKANGSNINYRSPHGSHLDLT